LAITEPVAAITAGLAKFSEAISCSLELSRLTSPSMASATSGSVAASCSQLGP
jgi:hypothetical protein